jgi:hypothetical protein
MRWPQSHKDTEARHDVDGRREAAHETGIEPKPERLKLVRAFVFRLDFGLERRPARRADPSTPAALSLGVLEVSI